MSKIRDSSVELLRILSMIFIICSHFCVHGNFETDSMDFSINKIILVNGILGNLGTVIFVMISGYFLSQTNFKISRIIKVMLQVMFYSCTIYFILVALNIIPFSIMGTIKSLFPILFNQYWFATTYVILIILSPYINRLINSFSYKQYVLFLGVILFMWSVVPTFTSQSLGSNEICQFIMFYSIGAFARKYQQITFLNKNKYWISLISAGLLLLSNIALNLLAIKNSIFNHGSYFYSRHSVLIIALSYGLLLIFVNMKIKNSKIINAISSTTFGIYLIHDNTYIRSIIWNDILRVNEYKYESYLILYLLICTIAVFLTCSMIDYLRQKFIEKTVFNALEPAINRVSDRVSSIVNEQHADD